ncbi:hypothetical protein RJ641_010640 [Dillenia turbinata]|uniref:Uncharacterized protein n=1 Tax=Dillenia turbinata TaxID=194707 RepID=A0AAN8UYZ2_9MAGN
MSKIQKNLLESSFGRKMSGFFSLGSGSGGGGGGGGGGSGRRITSTNPGQAQQPQQPQVSGISPEAWLWYRNEAEISLWHHHQQQQLQQQEYFQRLTTTSSSSHQEAAPAAAYAVANVPDEATASRSTAIMMRGGGGGGGSSSGGGTSCQDCGNQAKKDCSYMRCRTCCKSRGFDCATHLKSTWVPASKRRERQQQLLALHQQQQQQQQQQQLQLQISHPKRQREINPSTTTSGLEVADLPPQVNSPAVFRCVRVSSMDDSAEEYAYQTAVSIKGHIFKGILYHQGLAEPHYVLGDESSSGGGGGGAGSSAGAGAGGVATAAGSSSSAATFIDPSSSSAYTAAPLNAFMTGTQFFHPPRS